MYILSTELLDDISNTLKNVELILGNEVEFCEYIAIPSFGTNIILRFDYIGKSEITLDEFNLLEEKLRMCVGDKFMTNLMGSFYKNYGLDLSKLALITSNINELIDISICDNKYHKEGLENDIKTIIHLFHLENDTNIWEMQVNKNELLVLVLTKNIANNKETTTLFENKDCPINIKIQYLYDDGSFLGLMKAAEIAKINKVSMCQVLIDYLKGI